MSTNESVVFTGFSGLLKTHVLNPIVTHLSSKGVQCTVDELSGVLKLQASSVPNTPTPTATAFPPAMSSFPSVPANAFPPPATGGFPTPFGMPNSLAAFGGMPMSVAPAKGKSTKNKGPAQPVPDSERCVYTTIRGKNRGTRCEGRQEAGQLLCTVCKGKKAAQQQIQEMMMRGGAPQPGAAPQAVTGANMMVPGFPGTLPGMTNVPMPSATRIDVRPLTAGFYQELNHSLALKNGDRPGEYICCGIYDAKTNQISPLTPEKIEICKQMRLSYVDPNKQETVSGQTLPPTSTQMPTQSSPFPSMPGLPQPTQSAPLPGLPQSAPLPSMPGLPQPAQSAPLPSMPSLPSMSNMNQFGLPEVPAVSEMGKADEPVEEDEDEDDDNA